MIFSSEMAQCIPAAEEVLHSTNYALKIQRKNLTFFPDPYCVVLLDLGLGFFGIIFIYSENGLWKPVLELALDVQDFPSLIHNDQRKWLFTLSEDRLELYLEDCS